MNKKLLLFAFFTYILGMIVSFSVDISFPILENKEITTFFNELTELTKFEIWIKIFKNNLIVISFNMLGAFSFGILSFGSTLFNGFVLGYVIKNTLSVYSREFVIRYLAPHSIEILAIILSCYIGYKLGYLIFNYMFRNKVFAIQKSDYIVILISFSIIFLASLIEAYVTI